MQAPSNVSHRACGSDGQQLGSCFCCPGSLGFPLDHKTLTWRDTHWRERGFREYPWTLRAMQARGISSCSA